MKDRDIRLSPPHGPLWELEAGVDCFPPLSVLIMVLDVVNVGLRGRTMLCHFWQWVSLFLTVGETDCRLFWGLLWIPLAFGEANPQGWKGLWECYCNFLIQNIAGERLPGMGLEETGQLSWDELLRLLGWFCPLVVRGFRTPWAKWLPALNKGGSWVKGGGCAPHGIIGRINQGSDFRSSDLSSTPANSMD